MSPSRGRRHGQTSLETAIAILGAVLLLMGSLQIFFWVSERLVRRQMAYEDGRISAASDKPGKWDNTASKIRLRIFRAGNVGSNVGSP